jgi:hypothetical protein
VRPSSKGWGFKIDYAQAIREDEARIAHLTSPACIRLSEEVLPEAQVHYPGYAAWSAYELIVREPMRIAKEATLFNLTLEDMRAWAFFIDEEREEVWNVLGEEQKGDYARGKAIEARFGRDAFEVLSDDGRRHALAKARASLSRHKRNREKYEGSP